MKGYIDQLQEKSSKILIPGGGYSYEAHIYGSRVFIIEAVNDFFNLSTKKKRITEFNKGTNPYKIKTEIEQSNGKYTEKSTSLTWFFPFWKKTEKKIHIEEKILDYSDIEKEISKIRNYAQQR